MDLTERIDAELKTAMKASDATRVSALRMLKADVVKAAIDSRHHPGRLPDAQVIDVVRRQIKQRRESLEAFQKGGRADLVQKEQQELAILEQYLPPQMSEEALRAVVQECVQASGASGPKDLGKVMRLIMERVKGQADGKVVNQLVAMALGKGA